MQVEILAFLNSPYCHTFWYGVYFFVYKLSQINDLPSYPKEQRTIHTIFSIRTLPMLLNNFLESMDNKIVCAC